MLVFLESLKCSFISLWIDTDGIDGFSCSREIHLLKKKCKSHDNFLPYSSVQVWKEEENVIHTKKPHTLLQVFHKAFPKLKLFTGQVHKRLKLRFVTWQGQEWGVHAGGRGVGQLLVPALSGCLGKKRPSLQRGVGLAQQSACWWPTERSAWPWKAPVSSSCLSSG